MRLHPDGVDHRVRTSSFCQSSDHIPGRRQRRSIVRHHGNRLEQSLGDEIDRNDVFDATVLGHPVAMSRSAEAEDEQGAPLGDRRVFHCLP